MLKVGIVLQSSIVIDGSKIGFQGKGYLTITNKPNKDKAITLKKLKESPNVFLVTEMKGGSFDFLAIALVKDLANITSLIKEIRSIPTVEHVGVDLSPDTKFPVHLGMEALFNTEEKCENNFD